MDKIVISPLVARPVGEEFELEGIRLRVELAPEDGPLSSVFTPTCCVGCFMCDMDALCTDESWYSGLGSCDSYHRADGCSVIFKRI